MYCGKRLLDLVLTLLSIPIAIPLVLVGGFLLFLFSGQWPVFKQTRPGYKERCFTLYKLRTLYPAEDKNKRCNRIGKILRTFSIDELPQLLNVLKGEMSWVGPRPLLSEYLTLYNEEQRKRHLVLPGITGWAQIHGRNKLDWPQRFEHDLWYVKHQDLRLDIKIILKSFQKIWLNSDVMPEGLQEGEKFKGNE